MFSNFTKGKSQLRPVLEKLYAKYNRKDFIGTDPVQFVWRYRRRRDREIAAFLAAGLAYGRVAQIHNSLTRLLAIMGKSPLDFVLNLNHRRKNKLADFRHRFTAGTDIAELLELFRHIYANFESMEQFFCKHMAPDDANIIPALDNFCDSLKRLYAGRHGKEPPRGLRYLLAGPAGKSPAKRLNLFLRWMVRRDNIDTGLWRSIDPAKLIIPLDVHMNRLSGIIGFHNGDSVSLSTALKITQRFAQITPADPTKYDFALTRIGIVDNCTGRLQSNCRNCELIRFCSRR